MTRQLLTFILIETEGGKEVKNAARKDLYILIKDKLPDTISPGKFHFMTCNLECI